MEYVRLVVTLDHYYVKIMLKCLSFFSFVCYIGEKVKRY